MKSVFSVLVLLLTIFTATWAPAMDEAGRRDIQKRAEQGSSAHQATLASMYLNGNGVPQDFGKAFQWYARAAEQGNVKAQSRLGEMYYQGKGTPRNFSSAFKWFEKAADRGDADAHYRLSIMYYLGEAVAKNSDLGMAHRKKAAEMGQVDAQRDMASWFLPIGGRIPAQGQEAFQWRCKAAAQGDMECQYDLASNYEEGQDVARDLAKAAYWYKKAASQGSERARKKLEKLRALGH